jgi:ABC-type Na+ transport system ATPase subunit NatA
VVRAIVVSPLQQRLSRRVQRPGLTAFLITFATIFALGLIVALYARLTSREHIEYFGQLRGLPKEQLETNIEYWTSALGMEGIIQRRTGGFSHGERTKVAMARALVHRPQNVILDERSSSR